MIMISKCLAGERCRYDGGHKKSPAFETISRQEYVLFCPECLGELPIPREPAEICGGTGADVLDGKARVIDRSGNDVTEAFVRGAKKALELAKKLRPEKILMKAKSPSCGRGVIYDGSFSKTRIDGNGVTAELLLRNGFTVESID